MGLERMSSFFKRSKNQRNSTITSNSTSAKMFNPKPNPLPAFTNPSPSTRRPTVPTNPFSTTPAEPPPSYSPPADDTPITGAMSTTADNPYAFLSTFDTVFLIDDSGSMAGRSWKETAQALKAITPICTAHDADGIDVYFLNEKDSSEYRNITRAADVDAIFHSVRPRGGTPTGSRLNAILKPYLAALERKGADNVKPLNLIVITDGVASDDVESVIIAAAKKLDRWDAPAWQIGIQFFQVGEERGAAEALRELDDGLAEMGAGRDIVDTVPWKGESGKGLSADVVLKTVLGAVNRRLDRKRVSLDGRH